MKNVNCSICIKPSHIYMNYFEKTAVTSFHCFLLGSRLFLFYQSRRQYDDINTYIILNGKLLLAFFHSVCTNSLITGMDKRHLKMMFLEASEFKGTCLLVK